MTFDLCSRVIRSRVWATNRRRCSTWEWGDSCRPRVQVGHTHTHAQTHTHTQKSTHAHALYTHTRTYVHTHTHKHVYAHTYVRTYVHTLTQTFDNLPSGHINKINIFLIFPIWLVIPNVSVMRVALRCPLGAGRCVNRPRGSESHRRPRAASREHGGC